MVEGRQEGHPPVSLNDEDGDIPEDFYDTKWPHPRLQKNKPTGQDEALVWFMESEKEVIEQYIGRKLTNKNR